ncbi:MAG: ABC transporter ATP-binding protein [Candidatus Micrarchaeaceae archaeon]
MYVIEANNVGKRFKDTVALHRINLKLAKGETIILLGPNGAGKSTLLKILSGLYKTSKGTVKVFGHQLPKDAEKIRDSVSFLGENYSLYDDLTVRKNLEFFGILYDLDEKHMKRRIEQLLARFDATQYIDREVGELSRGTKQKVAICRALLSEPKLLLLDEPSAFLDPVASRILHMELNELSRKGVSIVYATQRLDELYKIGNKTLLLRKGRQIAYGNVDKIINKLRDVEVEIITAKPISDAVLRKFGKRWKVRYGDSNKAVIFSLKKINDIPKVVKEVVNSKCEIVSVLYLKESIDKILSGA